MLFMKLKAASAVALVLGGLTACGFALHTAKPVSAQTTAHKESSELETLRKENELLKLNLKVVLEKLHAREAEVKTLTTKSMAISPDGKSLLINQGRIERVDLQSGQRLAELLLRDSVNEFPFPIEVRQKTLAEAIAEVEEAAKAVREAKNEKSRRVAAGNLEKATQQVQKLLKSVPPDNPKKH